MTIFGISNLNFIARSLLKHDNNFLHKTISHFLITLLQLELTGPTPVDQ